MSDQVPMTEEQIKAKKEEIMQMVKSAAPDLKELIKAASEANPESFFSRYSELLKKFDPRKPEDLKEDEKLGVLPWHIHSSVQLPMIWAHITFIESCLEKMGIYDYIVQAGKPQPMIQVPGRM